MQAFYLRYSKKNLVIPSLFIYIWRMIAKWFFSTLIVVLALFGISSGQVATPNQEIVVQFNDDEVTLDEAQNAIAIVKKQLQIIGVENIRVLEGDDNGLKITYYSDVDVAVIKRIFSEGKKLELGSISYSQEKEPVEFPSKNNSTSYKLNVCEIHVSPDAEIDFNGYLLEVTSGNDSYFNPIVYFTVNEIDVRERNRIEKVAYTVQSTIALRLDCSSHNIPEVRAGPAPKGIS